MEKLNECIKIVDSRIKRHLKASEAYIHVEFLYPKQNITLNLWVPIEYRRTGISIDEEIKTR